MSYISPKTVLPSQQQLERYFEADSEKFQKTGLTKDLFFKTFHAGLNGLAWSPDGEFVVYTTAFGYVPENFNSKVKSIFSLILAPNWHRAEP